MKAVDGLIDMGIDVLQALQFSAKGMDPRVLKNQFGDRLCFEGGVSVQTTLPFGTTEDVSRETEELITILGKNGGYILGPSHYIQAGTPPENILAMFETALPTLPLLEIGSSEPNPLFFLPTPPPQEAQEGWVKIGSFSQDTSLSAQSKASWSISCGGCLI